MITSKMGKELMLDDRILGVHEVVALIQTESWVSYTVQETGIFSISITGRKTKILRTINRIVAVYGRRLPQPESQTTERVSPYPDA